MSFQREIIEPILDHVVEVLHDREHVGTASGTAGKAFLGWVDWWKKKISEPDSD